MTVSEPTKAHPQALPPIVDRPTWRQARLELLKEEKMATRARDALNAKRRRLPMVRVEKEYRFHGPEGPLRLVDLFDGRRQLYIHHFMWIDERDGPCLGCACAAELNFTAANRLHLHARDISFAAVARAPYEKIASLKQSRGWSFPFYSSFGSDFNYDFGVTLDRSRGVLEYNYQAVEASPGSGAPEDELEGDRPGNSIFLRDGETVYHTYSAYARGLDALFTPHNFLDLTPFGRQEAWEDSPPGWPKCADYGPDRTINQEH